MKNFEFIAGGVSGLTGLTVIYPSDHLVSVHQLNRLNNSNKIKLSDTFRDILKKDGPMGFYKGYLPIAVACTAKFGTNFFTYHKSHEFKLSNNKYVQDYLSGFITGVVSATFISSPTTNLKMRLIYSQNTLNIKNYNIINAMKDLYLAKGLMGFYLGYRATLLKDILSFGIKFPVYYQTKPLIESHVKNSIVASLVSGAIAGSISGLLVTPVDLAQTRLQVNYSSRYKGIWNVWSKVYKSEGVRGLYTGGLIRTLRPIPGMSIVFTVHEWLLSFTN